MIDYQNNGSPGAFVGLARAFEIPWIMICDNDQGGKDSIRQIQNRGLTGAELSQLVRPLPEDDMDWEMFLVKNGFIQEFRRILAERSVILTTNEDTAGFEDELAGKIRSDKTGYAITLIEKLQETSSDASKVPQFLQTLIEDVIAKA